MVDKFYLDWIEMEQFPAEEEERANPEEAIRKELTRLLLIKDRKVGDVQKILDIISNGYVELPAGVEIDEESAEDIDAIGAELLQNVLSSFQEGTYKQRFSELMFDRIFENVKKYKYPKMEAILDEHAPKKTFLQKMQKMFGKGGRRKTHRRRKAGKSRKVRRNKKARRRQSQRRS